MTRLTHLDEAGRARMVDVSPKPETARRATASSRVSGAPSTIALLAAGGGPKGDVFAVARVAAIQAAKKTAELIPLCHALPLDHVDVSFEIVEGAIEITATASTSARTGVEMEALTAASIAGLVIYDMAKAVERELVIGPTLLIAKEGGARGPWRRGEGTAQEP
jgi:cyclic pyranopterin phosphate synthase